MNKIYIFFNRKQNNISGKKNNVLNTAVQKSVNVMTSFNNLHAVKCG